MILILALLTFVSFKGIAPAPNFCFEIDGDLVCQVPALAQCFDFIPYRLEFFDSLNPPLPPWGFEPLLSQSSRPLIIDGMCVATAVWPLPISTEAYKWWRIGWLDANGDPQSTHVWQTLTTELTGVVALISNNIVDSSPLIFSDGFNTGDTQRWSRESKGL